MNVVLMPSSYPPNIGGVEEVTHGLARQLLRRGHAVQVIAPLWPAGLPESETMDGVPVVRVGYPMPSRNARSLCMFLARSAALARRQAERLHEFQADVVNVHCLGPNALYARWAARRAGILLVASTHGEFQGDDTRSARSRFMLWVRRTCIENAACVTACSGYTLRAIPFQLRGPAVVIPNAVDLPAVPAPSETAESPFAFCAARLSHNKGVDVLLPAFAGAGLDDGFQLWVAGDGDQRQALELQASNLSLGARCRFLGAQPRDEVQRLMQQCVFYLSPSRQEGFGISNLEAMAAGKAVLATRVGGVPEVVLDGETGILVPPEDPEALADGIHRLAGDSALRDRLGAAGRERAKQFTREAVTERYLEVYESVLGQGKERAGDG